MFLYLVKQYNEAVEISQQKFVMHHEREKLEHRQTQLESYSKTFISFLKESATENQRKKALNNEQLIIYINSHEGRAIKKELEEAGLEVGGKNKISWKTGFSSPFFIKKLTLKAASNEQKCMLLCRPK